MPPKRRTADHGWVMLVGWFACVALATSLTYTFISALSGENRRIDPLFFSLQTLASLLFLVYSIRLRNTVFIVANVVAVINAVGTLVVALVRRG